MAASASYRWVWVLWSAGRSLACGLPFPFFFLAGRWLSRESWVGEMAEVEEWTGVGKCVWWK